MAGRGQLKSQNKAAEESFLPAEMPGMSSYSPSSTKVPPCASYHRTLVSLSSFPLAAPVLGCKLCSMANPLSVLAGETACPEGSELQLFQLRSCPVISLGFCTQSETETDAPPPPRWQCRDLHSLSD